MNWKDTKFCQKPLFSIRGFVLKSVKSCYISAPFWSRLTLMSSKENCIFPTIINNQNWLNFFLKSIEISFGETKIQFSKTIRTTAGKLKQNLLTSSKALWHLSYIIWTGVLADLDPPRFGHPPRIWTPIVIVQCPSVETTWYSARRARNGYTWTTRDLRLPRRASGSALSTDRQTLNVFVIVKVLFRIPQRLIFVKIRK